MFFTFIFFSKRSVMYVALEHFHDGDTAHDANASAVEGTDTCLHLVSKCPRFAAVQKDINDDALVRTPLCSQLHSACFKELRAQCPKSLGRCGDAAVRASHSSRSLRLLAMIEPRYLKDSEKETKPPSTMMLAVFKGSGCVVSYGEVNSLRF